jgi:hypothetical protein
VAAVSIIFAMFVKWQLMCLGKEEGGNFQGNGVIFEAASDIPSDTLMGMRAWRSGHFQAKITGGS